MFHSETSAVCTEQTSLNKLGERRANRKSFIRPTPPPTRPVAPWPKRAAGGSRALLKGAKGVAWHKPSNE